MDISGKPLLFHLTASGQNAIGRMLPERGSFQGLVLGTDEIGAWVLFPGTGPIPPGEPVPMMLVKWEYVSTVVFEFKPEPPASKRAMGFVQAGPGN